MEIECAATACRSRNAYTKRTKVKWVHMHTVNVVWNYIKLIKKDSGQEEEHFENKWSKKKLRMQEFTGKAQKHVNIRN